jgi:Protein of unknown function (DUF4054)
MSAIAWSDVAAATDNDPIITAFASGGQTLILAVVNKALNVSLYDGEDGDITKLARCFLAAHMAASAKLGVTGAVTSESEGGISRSYAVPTGKSAYFTTSYGRLFWQLVPPAACGPRLL